MTALADRVARALASEQGAVLTYEIQADGSPDKCVEVWRDLLPFAGAAIAAVEDAVTAHAREETTGEEAALAFHIVANWLHNNRSTK